MAIELANIFNNATVTDPTFTGDLTLSTGNLVIGTTGKGIDFSANTDDAGMTSELLDDYEEGIWSGSFAFGGGTTGITFNASYTEGFYTKTGRKVTVTGYIILTSKGSDTGVATIIGLPFTVANDARAYSTVNLRLENISFANQYMAHVYINTNSIALEQVTEAGVITNLNDTNFADNSKFIIEATYFV